jgi:hypothetical protein
MEKSFMPNLKLWQLVLAIFFMLASPLVSGLTSYFKSQAAVSERINLAEKTSDEKLASHALRVEQRFAKSADYEKLSDKIDSLSDSLNEIKGYLRRRDNP